MRLTRKILIQLLIVIVIALTAGAVMGIGYMDLPARLFGIGRYTVTAELPEAGGLYRTGNVTYRGTEVGRVVSVHLTDSGVEATLSLDSKYAIPSDLDAQVHSQSAVGEQYLTLLPRNETSRPLRDGDVIARSRTSVPPDINTLLDAANRGLRAIPQDSRNDVRGGRNYPCITRPGKRAPTVKLCESDESYVPLNNGDAWKGDPNATLSGQGVPQAPPEQATPPGPPPVAAAWYDPSTGSYVGPDGRIYTQSDLARGQQRRTWQEMLTGPMKN